MRAGERAFDPSYLINLTDITGAKNIEVVYRFDDEHLLVQFWDPADPLPEGFDIAAYYNAPSFKTLKVNLQTGAAESLEAFPKATRGGDAELILDGVTYFQDVANNRRTLRRFEGSNLVEVVRASGVFSVMARVR